MAATAGQQWMGRELLGALARAKVTALQALGQDMGRNMEARAHVWTGEMKREVYFEVGTDTEGRSAVVAGSHSDHAIWEVLKRGGAHDFIHPAVDAVTPTIGARLQAALRAEGW
jgi:hypothetical protein